MSNLRIHLKHPFAFEVPQDRSTPQKLSIPFKQKVATVGLAILFGIPTLGLLAPVAFYVSSWLFKRHDRAAIIAADKHNQAQIQAIAKRAKHTPPSRGLPTTPLPKAKKQTRHLSLSNVTPSSSKRLSQ